MTRPYIIARFGEIGACPVCADSGAGRAAKSVAVAREVAELQRIEGDRMWDRVWGNDGRRPSPRARALIYALCGTAGEFREYLDDVHDDDLPVLLASPQIAASATKTKLTIARARRAAQASEFNRQVRKGARP